MKVKNGMKQWEKKIKTDEEIMLDNTENGKRKTGMLIKALMDGRKKSESYKQEYNKQENGEMKRIK